MVQYTETDDNTGIVLQYILALSLLFFRFPVFADKFHLFLGSRCTVIGSGACSNAADNDSKDGKYQNYNKNNHMCTFKYTYVGLYICSAIFVLAYSLSYF